MESGYWSLKHITMNGAGLLTSLLMAQMIYSTERWQLN